MKKKNKIKKLNMKNNELILGAVYRIYAKYTSTNERTGDYLDVKCDTILGTATILKCEPTKITRFIDGDWYVGGKINIKNKNPDLIAISIEQYLNKPTKDETINNKSVVYLGYTETFIDRLYNWYCRSKNRNIDEFV